MDIDDLQSIIVERKPNKEAVGQKETVRLDF